MYTQFEVVCSCSVYRAPLVAGCDSYTLGCVWIHKFSCIPELLPCTIIMICSMHKLLFTLTLEVLSLNHSVV